jgi:hypothetical protein
MPYPIDKLAAALLLSPRNVHVTLPVPPVPFDSICHDQPTFPLLPTVCAAPLNDTGALPVEYSTLAVQTAPGELYAYSVGYEPYEPGFGLTDARTENEPEGRTVGCGWLAGGAGGALLPAPVLKRSTGCSSIALGATPLCPCLKSKKPTPPISGSLGCCNHHSWRAALPWEDRSAIKATQGLTLTD